MTLCAATTHPDSRSKLKYSTVYPISGDCPADPLPAVPVPEVPPVVPGTVLLHEMVMEVARRSTILGLDGGCGKNEPQ